MLDDESMLGIVTELCKVPRFAGTAGSANARNIIESFLRENNYRYSLYTTQAPKWSLNMEPIVEFLKPKHFVVKAIPAIMSPPTSEQGVTGRVINAGQIKMLESFDWERFAVVDEIAGELAYLISSRYGGQMQPLPKEAQKTPHIILDSHTLEKIQKWLQAGTDIVANVKNFTSINGLVDVISIVTETPPNRPYPLICAHYDTVIGSVGAHDNASGIAVALTLAKELSQRKSCQLALFDGEEINRLGSQSFVDEMLKDGNIRDISFVLELDAVGEGREIALLCSKSLYKRFRKSQDELQLIDPNFRVTLNNQSKIGFSDVWSFMKESIPVIRMLSRDGHANDFMHTSSDTVDKINKSTLTASLNVARYIINKIGDDHGTLS